MMGNDMRKTIKRGDKVLVAKELLCKVTDISPGELVLVRIQESIIPCRLHKYPHYWTMTFDNPDLAPVNVEYGKLDIVGRILGVYRRL